MLGALRGFIFWKKDPPKLSQHLPGAPRALPELPAASQQLPRASQAAEAIAWRFFDFLRDVSNGIILFESILGSSFSKQCLKSMCFRRSCHEKVKKTITPERHKVTKYCKNQQLWAIFNSSADLPDPPDPGVREPEGGFGGSVRTGFCLIFIYLKLLKCV